MPSLIYITRIEPVSLGIAEGLESAGFHVRKFGPGEITADECLLVMTSAAVPSSLQSSGPALAAGGGPTLESFEAMLQLQSVHRTAADKTEGAQHFSSPAIEDGQTSARVSHARPAATEAPAHSSVVPQAGYLGFIPSQAGQRVIASHQNGAAQKAGLPTFQRTPPESNPLPSMPWREGQKQSTFGREVREAAIRSWRRHWKPAATVAALLIFAMALLGGRASISLSAEPEAEPASRGMTQSSDTLSSSPNPLSRSSAKSVILPESPVRISKSAAEMRRHIAEYDFVAEDYTTHFDLRAHGDASPQAPEFRRGGRNRLLPKRIVVN